jgi:hypothetical protein
MIRHVLALCATIELAIGAPPPAADAAFKAAAGTVLSRL